MINLKQNELDRLSGGLYIEDPDLREAFQELKKNNPDTPWYTAIDS